jgi:hypothetical protein
MDIAWAEAVLSIGIGIGLAAAAGLRVFVPLLVLGVAARLELLPLVGGFEWLSSNLGLGALAAATVLEIGAFYIPWLDNLLDLAAGPLAVLAGTLATAAVTTDLPPALHWAIAIVGGGGTAGIVKSVTSVVRLKSSLLTAGLGNFVVATLELAGSLVTAIIAILAPLIAVILIGLGLFLCYRASRALTAMLKPAR